MSGALQNQFRQTLKHLQTNQSYLSRQVSQLHKSKVSQYFWSLLHPSNLEKAAARQKKQDDKAATKLKNSLAPSSLTKDRSVGETRPTMHYAFINEDVVLPFRSFFVNNDRNVERLTKTHRLSAKLRTAMYPDRGCPEPLSCPKKSCEEPSASCKVKPCGQLNSCLPNSCESPSQRKPCSQNPRESCSQSKASLRKSTMTRSKDYSSPMLHKPYVKKSSHSTNDSVGLSKNNALTKFSRDFSSFMGISRFVYCSESIIKKGQFIGACFKVQNRKFHESSAMHTRKRNNNRSSRDKGGLNKKNKSKSTADEPEMTEGKTICTADDPEPEPKPKIISTAARNNSAPIKETTGSKSESSISSCSKSKPQCGSSDERKREPEILLDSDGQKGREKIGDCHLNSDLKKSCSGELLSDSCSTKKSQCGNGPKRSFSTAAIFPAKYLSENMTPLTISTRSFKINAPVLKDDKKEKYDEKKSSKTEINKEERQDIEKCVKCKKRKTDTKIKEEDETQKTKK